MRASLRALPVLFRNTCTVPDNMVAIGAVDVALSPDDLARLDELAPAGVAAGERYASMESIDR